MYYYSSDEKPLILLIFANNDEGLLRSVRQERQELIGLLKETEARYDFEVKETNHSKVIDVLDILNTRRERLILIHFAGHSEQELLHLDDGSLHVEGIAPKLRRCPNLQLVFLNGCSNQRLVDEIFECTIPNVIGTKSKIGDVAAREFSYAFYKALVSQNLDINQSFEQAQEDIKSAFRKDINRSLAELGKIQSSWLIRSKKLNWKLSEETHPCNRLPRIKITELPLAPFKSLHSYVESDAAIFFGRCQEIIEIIDIIKNTPESIILITANSGIGKTSLINAGILPRINNKIFKIDIRNSDTKLQSLLEVSQGLIVIDHFEELYKKNAIKKELNNNLKLIKIKNKEKLVKIIILARSEWGVEIENDLENNGINYIRKFIEPLSKKNIIEAIEGPFESPEAKKKYRINISKNSNNKFSEHIANDLIQGEDSNVTPALQLIMYKLWRQARASNKETISFDMYSSVRKSGVLLFDQINNMIDKLSAKYEKKVSSGLIVDILMFHINDNGFPKNILKTNLLQHYDHIKNLEKIIDELIDNFILTRMEHYVVHKKDTYTRISHDLIANLIQKISQKSTNDAQQSKRILTSKSYLKLDSILLDKLEYKMIKNSLMSMSKPTKDEEKIIKNSEFSFMKRKVINSAILFFSTLMTLTVIIGVVA